MSGVGAVDGAAALHQQRRALAAEPGARGDADTLELGRQRDRADLVIIGAHLDEARMTGVGYMAHQADVRFLEHVKDILRPIGHHAKFRIDGPRRIWRPARTGGFVSSTLTNHTKPVL